MKITIIGEGAWGKALGMVAQKAGHEVHFWSRQKPVLPKHSDALILAVPAQVMREVLTQLGLNGVVLISSAKGFERSTGKSMADVVSELVPQAEFYALSGPSFAADVMAGLPTAVTLAGPDLERASHWANELSIPTFRIYPSDDVTGVEIGGAMKNVLAIACGIADGQGLGESARASLVTRGFAELARYARKAGGKPETLMGLSGFGDLQLTCSSAKSRNYSYGLAIGNGATPQSALAASKGVVEGAATAAIAARLARDLDVDMPIVDAVTAVIDGGSKPGDEIKKLLSRPVRPEHE
ncbi:NAD(P)H-dependent glycerol-3-phosphate dehydrogenase [Aestuariivirga litoralis]|uniref:NAD(P)H-dependent glycerol-3-phosphate dehydrogenase n=1 Tax=Aestuariivirga litoralis TaxID=2650924 RepID=UPI0018C7F5CB|nr:NAD(P)H-dependent glycerol-3-phosphate dehydrogenase [Aestuariivirga litoralis]MBG1232496.1 NAD(P)-dependent glycerol-3-phosphate dehydrogenase [Aestuariivirga litoralis]